MQLYVVYTRHKQYLLCVEYSVMHLYLKKKIQLGVGLQEDAI